MHVSELVNETRVTDSYNVNDGQITIGTYIVIPIAIHGDKGSNVEKLAYEALDVLRDQMVDEINRQIAMAKEAIETTARRC